jgi:hypothetical protein
MTERRKRLTSWIRYSRDRRVWIGDRRRHSGVTRILWINLADLFTRRIAFP